MAHKIAILGGGESGVGAALLAQAKGMEVFLSDMGTLGEAYRQTLLKANIAFEEWQHTEAKIFDADEIIKSPGIPDTAPLVVALREAGKSVIGEIEFASRFTKAKLITITGSNGKTTTTLLAYHFLKATGFSVGLAGNIGESFAKQVIADSFDYYVLEISSFMLDSTDKFKADTAVLLNITPDHLDRYGYVFQNYVESKFRTLRNLTPNDTFIYWQESEAIAIEIERLGGTKSLLPRQLPISIESALVSGAWLNGSEWNIAFGGKTYQLPASQLPMAGLHNAFNTMAALLAALSVGADFQKVIATFGSFQNAPHRLEPVATIDGVRYVNDSKATNVDSVMYALGSFTEPLVLIMGGKDKGNDYEPIRALVQEKVHTLVCLGKDNSALKTYFSGIVPTLLETNDVHQAVTYARAAARPGDVVLLSPACASFDLFKNYEDRGDRFKAAVGEMSIG